VDFDCLAERSPANLDRLAHTLQELNARLRVDGLSDEESRTLPVVVDAQMFLTIEISTNRPKDQDALPELAPGVGSVRAQRLSAKSCPLSDVLDIPPAVVGVLAARKQDGGLRLVVS